MAISVVPTDWIPNWSYSAPNITIPIASFPEMSEEEAHPSAGDFPDILYAILHAIYAKWASLDMADRPVNMTMSRGISGDPDTDVLEETFTIRFNTKTATGSRNVVDEA